MSNIGLNNKFIFINSFLCGCENGGFFRVSGITRKALYSWSSHSRPKSASPPNTRWCMFHWCVTYGSRVVGVVVAMFVGPVH